MAETPADDPIDEGLLELLAVEQRLQRLVQQAKEDASRLVAEARAASERRMSEARHAEERANAERARAEAIAHQETLAGVDAAGRAVLADLMRISDERINELARWALAKAITVEGDLT
jgi:hypothetical protein